MRFGLDFPPFNELSDPRLLAEIGATAEQAGWDGVFLWDHIMYRAPADGAGDPWIGLAAIAAAIEDALSPFDVRITQTPITPPYLLELLDGVK